VTSGPKKRIRDHHELLTAAQQIQTVAHAQGTRIALVGGLAMQLYGSPRLTSDIDIVSTKPLMGVPSRKRLTFGGYQSTAANGVPVDVKVVGSNDEPLYDAALSFAVRMRGAPLLVVRPEYIVAMKMVAARPRDESDFDFLVTDYPLDVSKAERVVRRYLGPYGLQDFKSRRSIVCWKKETGKL
jgi:hypothetical protein